MQVAERVLVGDQFDEVLPAERIQRQDLFAGDGRFVGPRLGVTAEGEGVFGVELDLVDLPCSPAVR
ncbi:MAG: hypothetical protein R2838_12925 [Caldilineaceae bacterium]